MPSRLTPQANPPSKGRWILHLGFVVFAVVNYLFLVVVPYWRRSDSQGTPTTGTPSEILSHVLLALACVIVLGAILARVLGLIGQPRVLGEMLAGILLGPSVLGAISSGTSQFILPTFAASHFSVIGQLGIVLYMFIVGLELHGGVVRSNVRSAIIVSLVSILVPFILGYGLALLLPRELKPTGVSTFSYALFMGVGMAITAFPVLARILSDRNIQSTWIGQMALGCAAMSDVVAWIVLALIVAIIRSESGNAIDIVAGSLAYLSVMLLFVSPIVSFACRSRERMENHPGEMVAVIVGVLLSALAAEAVGLHAIFGAFLAGAIIPHESRIAKKSEAVLREVTTYLLLPAFFATTGLRTELGLLHSGKEWLACVAIIVVATLGKVGGVFVAARACGMNARTSSALGFLMNTRGLMELIVLGVGLDMGIITPSLYAMMVLMAIVTTMATSPALILILRGEAKAAVSDG